MDKIKPKSGSRPDFRHLETQRNFGITELTRYNQQEILTTDPDYLRSLTALMTITGFKTRQHQSDLPIFQGLGDNPRDKPAVPVRTTSLHQPTYRAGTPIKHIEIIEFIEITEDLTEEIHTDNSLEDSDRYDDRKDNSPAIEEIGNQQDKSLSDSLYRLNHIEPTPTEPRYNRSLTSTGRARHLNQDQNQAQEKSKSFDPNF